MLEEGERVELWLTMPGSGAPHPGAQDYAADTDISQLDIDGWDVRPAQVAGVAPGASLPDTAQPMHGGAYVALAAGGWGLTGAAGTPSAPGARAIVRRVSHDGIAEWEGVIAAGNEPVEHGEAAGETDVVTAGHVLSHVSRPAIRDAEAVLVIRIETEGRHYQRRRSPRLSVRLSPIRLVPMSSTQEDPPTTQEVPSASSTAAGGASPPAHPDALQPPPAGNRQGVSAHRALAGEPDFAPVARLSDVSATGAAIVVDTPLETGTTVALEFDLPGESAPFTIRGRVVEPAVSLHGEAQPQPDGLPGFRRGIEFLGHAAGRESRRLTAVLSRLRQRPPH